MTDKAWPTQWLTVNEDEVVILGDAARDILFADKGEIIFSRESITDAQVEEFNSLFAILAEDNVLGDPNEDFYQGVTFIKVIRRLSDDKLFGYTYWTPVSKNGETYLEANGTDHGYNFPDELTDAPGFNWDEDYVSAWVFLPVKPFTVTGYELVEKGKN